MSVIAQVTSYPFGISSSDPLDKLRAANIDFRLSPHERKHTGDETSALLGDVDILLAATEHLNGEQIARGLPRLKHIARVGVGLDGLDIRFCAENNIAVTYTPDAPARSVVEQVFGQLICLGRRFIEAHEGLRRGEWNRLTGTCGKTRHLAYSVVVGSAGKLPQLRHKPLACKYLLTILVKIMSGLRASLDLVFVMSRWKICWLPVMPLPCTCR